MLDLDRRAFFALYGGDDARGSVLFAMIALTVLGSGWSLLGLAPLFVLPRARRFALAMLGALVTTGALVFVLKRAVGRVRPLHALDGVRGLVDAPTDFSFPSGHAAGSFAFAAFVATALLASPRPRGATASVVGLFALAAAVSLSRVYLGCHFPGDVAGGALLGAAVGATAGRAYTRRARPSTPT